MIKLYLHLLFLILKEEHVDLKLRTVMLPSQRSLINSLDLNEISVLNVKLDTCGMKIPGLVFLPDFLIVSQLLQENVLFVRQGLLQMLKASVF